MSPLLALPGKLFLASRGKIHHSPLEKSFRSHVQCYHPVKLESDVRLYIALNRRVLHSFIFPPVCTLGQPCPTHGPHEAQSKVLCGPVEVFAVV